MVKVTCGGCHKGERVFVARLDAVIGALIKISFHVPIGHVAILDVFVGIHHHGHWELTFEVYFCIEFKAVSTSQHTVTLLDSPSS